MTAVTLQVTYDGALRCNVQHEPSGATIMTDAPVDNHGLGRSFSPTDLVAAAAGTCILTVFGIVAQKHGVDLSGSKASVKKEMAVKPLRRIGGLHIEVDLSIDPSDALLTGFQKAMRTPVEESLGSDVGVTVVVRSANGRNVIQNQ
jgi:putative redox protein